MKAVAAEFMAANPDIKIELPFLENEAFKAKLTTLLQSADAPDVFHSWGGGVFYEQAAAGVLRPVEDVLSAGSQGQCGHRRRVGLHRARWPPLWHRPRRQRSRALVQQDPVRAGRRRSRQHGDLGRFPGRRADSSRMQASPRSPSAPRTSGRLTSGGPSWLSVWQARMASTPPRAAKATALPAKHFVKAGEYFLAARCARARGRKASWPPTYGDASGYFGDGKAAMHLMGDWDYGAMKDNSANKAGIPDDQLGILPFPTIEGGKGDPTDTLGGLGGVLFTKNASDEAVKFDRVASTAPRTRPSTAKDAYLHPDRQGCCRRHDQPLQGADRPEHRQCPLARAVLRSGAGPAMSAASSTTSRPNWLPMPSAREEAAELVKEAVDDSL